MILFMEWKLLSSEGLRGYEAYSKLTDTVLPDTSTPDAVSSATSRQAGESGDDVSEDGEAYGDD